MADGKLIVLGEAGLLGLFKPNTEKPEEISRWQVPGLTYPCWGAPILADRRLYLRSENKLICLDLAKKEFHVVVDREVDLEGCGARGEAEQQGPEQPAEWTQWTEWTQLPKCPVAQLPSCLVAQLPSA